MAPSLSLRGDQNRAATTEWLSESVEGQKYLNMVLLLIHPDLHAVGSSILDRLRSIEGIKDVALLWTSYFTGIAVINNRKTPSHHDSNGRPEWYDLLCVMGNSDRPAKLEFKELGLRLVYGPGTVVGACGQVFEHSVDFWGEGDRICHAHFMRDKVREKFDVKPGGWVTQDLYASCLSKAFRQDKHFV